MDGGTNQNKGRANRCDCEKGNRVKLSNSCNSYTTYNLHLMAMVTKTSIQKKSFAPFSNAETSILILGTLPGDKSLELQEYYGHPRNKFWKIIATITNNDLPVTFSDKKAMLLKVNIGIWDIAQKADRKGSLDSAIQNVYPNDLNGFLSKHKQIKVIGFNGIKAEKLFNKYFLRQPNIRYILLPSSSPANAGISFETICKQWSEIFSYD